MSIAKNLRQLRLLSGMTQEQVAEKIGVTRQTLSNYESGRTRPDVDMLAQLSAIYGTDIDGVVYGENRTLKMQRSIKIVAIIVYGLLAVLTVVSSALLWSANRFYSISTGQLSAEEAVILQSRMKLTAAWETMDSIILTVALLGFVALVVLLAALKCRILMKTKVFYAAVLAATLLVIALLFGITDPQVTPVNYLFTPIFVIVRMAVLFVVHIAVELLQKRGKKIN